MDKVLLDTDIFSEILKGINKTVISQARSYYATFGKYTTSVITVMEIVKGFHKVTPIQTTNSTQEIYKRPSPCQSNH